MITLQFKINNDQKVGLNISTLFISKIDHLDLEISFPEIKFYFLWVKRKSGFSRGNRPKICKLIADLVPSIVTTPPSSPTATSDNVDTVAKRHRAPTVSRIFRELEKLSTLRSRQFVPIESFAEETDSSTQVTITSDTSSQLETLPGVRSMFAKNRQKISGTMPRNVNLQYLKQISTGVAPTYRRHRRVGIHVPSSDSTEVWKKSK